MAKKVGYFRPSWAPSSKETTAAYQRGEQRLADNRFYASARWRKLRAWFLASNPLCARCESEGRTTAAAHVHHLIERKERPDLALDVENLQALCQPCHNAVRHHTHDAG